MKTSVVLLAALILAGCGMPQTHVAPRELATCSEAGGGLFYCELQNGTRCVVDRGNWGGIDCEFPSPTPTVKLPEAGQAYITEAGSLEWVR